MFAKSRAFIAAALFATSLTAALAQEVPSSVVDTISGRNTGTGAFTRNMRIGSSNVPIFNCNAFAHSCTLAAALMSNCVAGTMMGCVTTLPGTSSRTGFINFTMPDTTTRNGYVGYGNATQGPQLGADNYPWETTNPVVATANNASIASMAAVQAAIAATGPIRTNVVKTLCATGCDFSSLLAFRDWIYTQTIVGNNFITLNINDGTYPLTDQFFIQSPLFNRVSIIGNRTTPANVVINASTAGLGLPAFGASNGAGLLFIDGVTVNGIGAYAGTPGVWNNNAFDGAFVATGPGSSIHVGGHVVVNNYYYGLYARKNGYALGDAGFTVNNSGDVNIFAAHGGVTECPYCIAHTASHTKTRLPDGTYLQSGGTDFDPHLGANFQAENGGVGLYDGSIGTGGRNAGALVALGGNMWCHNCQMSGSTAGRGFSAILKGNMAIDGSVATGNALGVGADSGGFVNGDNLQSYSNTGDGIFVNGATFWGAVSHSYNNGGVGYRSIVNGEIRAPGSLSITTGNTAGVSFVDIGAACTNTASTACQPASMILVN